MNRSGQTLKALLLSSLLLSVFFIPVASAQENFSLHQLLRQEKPDEAERYVKNLEADLQSFASLAAKLQMLSEGALKSGSYLDKLADPTRLTNQQQLRPAYRFWHLFYTFLQDLEKISEKYEVPLVFNHSRKVERYFSGYVLGISARFCRLLCVSELMNFLAARPRLAELLNESNSEFSFPARSLDRSVKASLKPETLAHLYRFRISHYEELSKLLTSSQSKLATMPATYLLANKGIFDELSDKVANDPTWKFLSLSVINYSLDFILPAQRSVFTWVGDTRVKQQNTRLISGAQRKIFQRMLQPGDIVLSRQEWYLSNIFLPGFWPHAMLYVGSEAEISRKLDSDPEVKNWYRKNGLNSFAELLQQDFPKAYRSWKTPGAKDNKPRLFIEATSDGIILESLGHSCNSDHLAAIRPNLRPLAIAKAIHTAFSYFGREYDFQFSFNTEQTLVCTELVSKSYAAPGQDGLLFPVVERLGKRGIPADTMVETFARGLNSDRPQLDFVACLKGNRQTGQAKFVGKKEFVNSYKWQGGLKSTLTND